VCAGSGGFASSKASTAEPARLRSYFGGPSLANAARTVLRETPNVLAIVLIGNPSARCSLRISAQSSTDNNSLLLSARKPRLRRRGRKFGRRHGVSFQAAPTPDDQHSAMKSGPGITVGHENLRSGMGPRQATPHPGVLFTSCRHARYQRHVQVHLGATQSLGSAARIGDV
jgi:hypothetical protein